MQRKFIVDKFNKLDVFDININHLRSKNFYKNTLINRNYYYNKYKKYLNKKTNICHLCKTKQNSIFLTFKKYQLRKCFNCKVIFSNLNLKKFRESDFFKKIVLILKILKKK